MILFISEPFQLHKMHNCVMPMYLVNYQSGGPIKLIWCRHIGIDIWSGLLCVHCLPAVTQSFTGKPQTLRMIFQPPYLSSYVTFIYLRYINQFIFSKKSIENMDLGQYWNRKAVVPACTMAQWNFHEKRTSQHMNVAFVFWIFYGHLFFSMKRVI